MESKHFVSLQPLHVVIFVLMVLNIEALER